MYLKINQLGGMRQCANCNQVTSEKCTECEKKHSATVVKTEKEKKEREYRQSIINSFSILRQYNLEVKETPKFGLFTLIDRKQGEFIFSEEAVNFYGILPNLFLKLYPRSITDIQIWDAGCSVQSDPINTSSGDFLEALILRKFEKNAFGSQRNYKENAYVGTAISMVNHSGHSEPRQASGPMESKR